jgi:hypothetical protein
MVKIMGLNLLYRCFSSIAISPYNGVYIGRSLPATVISISTSTYLVGHHLLYQRHFQGQRNTINGELILSGY